MGTDSQDWSQYLAEWVEFRYGKGIGDRAWDDYRRGLDPYGNSFENDVDSPPVPLVADLELMTCVIQAGTVVPPPYPSLSHPSRFDRIQSDVRDEEEGMVKVGSGPHSFRPLRLWDVRSHGRCRHCYLPAYAHPVRCWVPARPLGDKRKAEVTWETLNAENNPLDNGADYV